MAGASTAAVAAADEPCFAFAKLPSVQAASAEKTVNALTADLKTSAERASDLCLAAVHAIAHDSRLMVCQTALVKTRAVAASLLVQDVKALPAQTAAALYADDLAAGCHMRAVLTQTSVSLGTLDARPAMLMTLAQEIVSLADSAVADFAVAAAAAVASAAEHCCQSRGHLLHQQALCWQQAGACSWLLVDIAG